MNDSILQVKTIYIRLYPKQYLKNVSKYKRWWGCPSTDERLETPLVSSNVHLFIVKQRRERRERYWSCWSYKYQWAVLLTAVIDSLTLDPVTAGRYGLTHLRYGTELPRSDPVKLWPKPNTGERDRTETETGQREERDSPESDGTESKTGQRKWDSLESETGQRE